LPTALPAVFIAGPVLGFALRTTTFKGLTALLADGGFFLMIVVALGTEVPAQNEPAVTGRALNFWTMPGHANGLVAMWARNFV
jgi:hypothetical protein